jgi:hypothetical protein
LKSENENQASDCMIIGYCEPLEIKDTQRTTSDCKIEIVTRFDTDNFFIQSFKKQ